MTALDSEIVVTLSEQNIRQAFVFRK